MRGTHLIGLALWRGGVLLVGGYLAYQVLRAILTFTDAQLEVAVAVFLTGLIMVFLSLVVERVQDAKAERRDLL
jgi:branched-subunit amino acid ABC-type transport system permease component